MSNLVEQPKHVSTFYIVQDASCGQCLSPDGELNGGFSYGAVQLEPRQNDEPLNLNGQILFTGIDDCLIFENFSDARTVATAMQEKDPEGEYQVVEIKKLEAVLYTLGDVK